MATDKNPYSATTNLRLKNGIVRFDKAWAASPIPVGFYGLFRDTAGDLYWVKNGVASKLDTSAGGLPSLPDGEIWVGDNTNVATGVTPSGDVTMDNAGVFTIEDDAITTQKILDDAVTTDKILDEAVTLAKLDPGVAPSHVAKFGGKLTWSGGSTTAQASVAGVVAGDLVVASISTKPTEAAYLVAATPGTDVIDFELSAANTSNDAIITYLVFSAAA